ncbi:MAG: NYN domain-containing protein, partial [Atopostipes suicloacalis]|nr:NYN domain-containing protein [Atopostipes suicloacalis]
EQHYAVLVDAENVSPKYIKIIFDEASNYGITTYRRIYGDWTSTRNNGWKSILLNNSITPIQQYSYTDGKNSSDSAMIIDAMDILYTSNVDGFIIVSSDSDFTRLASRLRESGMTVIGMGESKTPGAFISACNSFKYLDILYQNIEAEEDEVVETKTKNNSSFNISPKNSKNNTENDRKKYHYAKKNKKRRIEHKSKKQSKPQPQTKITTIRKALKTIILENSDDDSWISLANLGNHLSKRFPDFDVRNYGHKKLVTFVQSLGDFEIEHRSISSDGKTKQLFVRIK